MYISRERHTHTNIMGYYSAMREEILPFETTWMDPKIDTYINKWLVEKRKPILYYTQWGKSDEDEDCMIWLIGEILRSWIDRNRALKSNYQVLGDVGNGDELVRVQTASYKINKFLRPNVQHNYQVSNTVSHF